MNEESKHLFCKTFNNGEASKTVTLSEEEEAKLRALHDVETLRILRTCMQDAEYLTDNKEASLRIALALFDKRCEKIDTRVETALNEKVTP
jgi:hypothetical protein